LTFSLGGVSHMLGTQHYSLFLLSGILLNITPGQDTLYIVGRSVAQGWRAGLLSVLGIGSGAIIHTVAVAFGLSAVLATSASAFLFLGTSFLTTGTIWCVFLALAASAMGSRLRTSAKAGVVIRRATGALFAGLGLRLALGK
jgi:threonine/homoserine/homoserine lactone efflux protein